MRVCERINECVCVFYRRQLENCEQCICFAGACIRFWPVGAAGVNILKRKDPNVRKSRDHDASVSNFSFFVSVCVETDEKAVIYSHK